MTATIAISAYELRNDPTSFNAIGKLYIDLLQFENTLILLDFAKLGWIDAHLSAALKTVIMHSKRKGNTHRLINALPDIQLLFRRNGLVRKKVVDIYGTTMPIKEFGLDEHNLFALYAKNNLSRSEMPKMTEQLQRKFHEGIDELFANSSMHSKSLENIVAAGQVYPRKRYLSLALSDGGIGIIGTLKNTGIKIRNHSEAIDWAMQKNNTSRKGDIPGGLGLAVLREFIAKNKGKLFMVSKKGFWCQSGSTVKMSALNNEFPGTCVIVEINTADTKSYDLRTQIPAKDVW